MDEEQTNLIKSGVLYMAVPINSGEHTIMLKYSTPGLRLGCVGSVLVLVFVYFLETSVRRKRKE